MFGVAFGCYLKRFIGCNSCSFADYYMYVAEHGNFGLPVNGNLFTVR